MAQELTIPLILKIGKLSQVLSNVDNQKNTLFKGATIDQRLPRTIYEVWKPLFLRYTANPNDVTVRGVAEYLLSLCGPYALQSQQILNNLGGALPVITGPSNQSGVVGFTATFSVSVVSSTTVSYQWYRNGVLIPGATNSSYMLTNAQIADSGSTFFVTATNATGTVISNTATLTVTAAITGYLYYNAADPGPTLQANLDPFTYQTSYTITHNAAIPITLPGASTPNMYLVIKIPIGESTKSTWFNTALNNGSIPDSVFQSFIQFGGNTYYYTRVAVSMDTSQTLILS